MAADARLVGQVSGGGTTLTTTSGTTTTGSTFEICISGDNGATISSVGDNKGNVYTLVGTRVNGGGSSHFKAMYRCENGTGGTGHTANAVFSSDPFGSVYLVECTSVAAASLDKAAQGTPATSPFTVTTAALSQADEVCVALFGTASSTPGYASSNFTILGSETNGASFWTSCVGKLVVAATTAVTPSFTDSSGNTDTGLIVGTFKGAVIASGGARLSAFFAQPMLRGPM